MDAWQLWLEMAREASEAAAEAEASGCLRSTASRYYYAAYQAATALLLYQGLMPPVRAEAWSHTSTPALLNEGTASLIASRDRRTDLAARLGELYRLRLDADYVGINRVSRSRLAAGRRDARFIIKVVTDILPEKLQ